MSKSKGGFLTVSLLEEKGYNPVVYRMFCLQSHYRKPLTFSYDNLDNTAKAYNKLVKKISNLNPTGEPNMEEAQPFIDKFKENMDNDLNTSLGITSIYDVLKANISDATKIYLLNDFDKVLSLDLVKTANKLKEEKNSSVDTAKVEELIRKRTEARANKDWATADAIRDELNAMNVVIKDTPEGITWSVK